MYQEVGIPPEPVVTSTGQSSHGHTHSSASINREDIEQAKQHGITARTLNDYREDVSESATASASVSTAMHQMVDGLLASETSEELLHVEHFPQISHGESFPTPTLDSIDLEDSGPGIPFQDQKTLTAQYLVKQMQGSRSTGQAAGVDMRREETIRPPIPSIWTTPFTPLPGETSSPQTRPGTAHMVSSNNPTPLSQSSGASFQQEILRRQQILQMQQSSPLHSPQLPNSWSRHQSPVIDQFARQDHPYLSRQPASPAFHGPPSSPNQEVHREAPLVALYGAVGQTPPSGQAG